MITGEVSFQKQLIGNSSGKPLNHLINGNFGNVTEAID